MSDESKTTYVPTHAPIPAGTVPEWGGSIPKGTSPFDGADLGPNATLLDYMVPLKDSESYTPPPVSAETQAAYVPPSKADDERKR